MATADCVSARRSTIVGHDSLWLCSTQRQLPRAAEVKVIALNTANVCSAMFAQKQDIRPKSVLNSKVTHSYVIVLLNAGRTQGPTLERQKLLRLTSSALCIYTVHFQDRAHYAAVDSVQLLYTSDMNHRW